MAKTKVIVNILLIARIGPLSVTYIFFQTSLHELESLDSDIHMQVNSCEWNEV